MIVFSKPLTFPRTFQTPQDFCCFEEEAKLSWGFGKKLPPFLSDRVVRLFLTLKLLKARRHADLIVTGRYGEYFALWQGLIQAGRKKHLLLDIEWYGSWNNKRLDSFKKLLHGYIARGSYKLQVFCEQEAHNYSSHYGIPIEKFVWLPYCSELNREDYEVREDNYIFTGGLHNRDYETLHRAVKDLPIEIKIAAPKDSLKQELLSKNMTVLGVVSGHDYYNIMAKSKLVVLSLAPDVRRYPGVITYVSAMMLGKPVIVNDLHGAKSYFPKGTGVLIEPRNPTALRKAIIDLLENKELRTQISEKGYLHAREHFSPERLTKDMERLASEACNQP